MKKIAILFLPILGVVFNSCNYESPKYKALKEEKLFVDSLYLDQKNTIEDILTELQYIEDNFNQIKQAENVFIIDDQSIESTNSKDRKVLWEDNFSFIKEKLEENKTRLSTLEGKLKKSSLDKQVLERRVKEMVDIVDQKEVQYRSLEVLLNEKNIELTNLGKLLQDRDSEIETLQDKALQKEKELQDIEKANNEVYYLAASKKDLKTLGIISKNSSSTSSKLLQKGDTSGFTKIDKRNTNSIELDAKKAIVLTNHPSDSYVIEKKSSKITIKISNTTKFWNTSRYLVIQTD